jgi:hypothetical protein
MAKDRVARRAPPTSSHDEVANQAASATVAKRIGKDGKARARPKKKPPVTARQRSIDEKLAPFLAKFKEKLEINDRELRGSVQRLTGRRVGRPARPFGRTRDDENRSLAVQAEGLAESVLRMISIMPEDIQNAWNNASEHDRKAWARDIALEQLSKLLPSGSLEAARTYVRKGRRELERDWTRTGETQYTRPHRAELKSPK